MSQVVIIADDLTGAADAGVMFCPFFRPVLLVADSEKAFGTIDWPQAAVLAVSTDSRALAPEVARKRMHSFLAGLGDRKPGRLFKKIDSSLRGNIGAEADAIIAATAATGSFIAAAFPALGRTTMGGIHAVHGVPVADTELRRDPVTPVVESRIAAVVAGQSSHPVGHIDLDVLEADMPRLQAKVRHLRAQGCVHLTFDASCDAHLDTIVALADTQPEQILLVGSAGLAMAAARHWGGTPLEDRPENLVPATAGVLYVCGTAAAQTARQIAELEAFCACPVVSLEPGLLADSRRRADRKKLCKQIPWPPRQTALVLKVAADPAEGQTGKSPWPASEVARGLGLTAAQLVRKARPLALFCCGGDTASAFMQELGAWGSELSRTVVPGMVFGRLRGGFLDGVPLVTKPGSFGERDDLVELLRWLLATKKG